MVTIDVFALIIYYKNINIKKSREMFVLFSIIWGIIYIIGLIYLKLIYKKNIAQLCNTCN